MALTRNKGNPYAMYVGGILGCRICQAVRVRHRSGTGTEKSYKWTCLQYCGEEESSNCVPVPIMRSEHCSALYGRLKSLNRSDRTLLRCQGPTPICSLFHKQVLYVLYILRSRKLHRIYVECCEAVSPS